MPLVPVVGIGSTAAKLGKDAIKLGGDAAAAGKAAGALEDSAKVGGKASKPKRSSGPVVKTNKEAIERARALGYRRVGGDSKRELVFKKIGNRPGPKYITRDKYGHNGGAWKGADTIEELRNKKTRKATYDLNLKEIGK